MKTTSKIKMTSKMKMTAKKILPKNLSDPQKFVDPNFFCKRCFEPNIILDHNYFFHNNFIYPNFLCPKIFDRKFFRFKCIFKFTFKSTFKSTFKVIFNTSTLPIPLNRMPALRQLIHYCTTRGTYYTLPWGIFLKTFWNFSKCYCHNPNSTSK